MEKAGGRVEEELVDRQQSLASIFHPPPKTSQQFLIITADETTVTYHHHPDHCDHNPVTAIKAATIKERGGLVADK